MTSFDWGALTGGFIAVVCFWLGLRAHTMLSSQPSAAAPKIIKARREHAANHHTTE